MSSFRLFFAVTVVFSAIASASSKPLPFQVKVLSAESQSFKAPALDPPNCNFHDIDAYCSSSSPQTYVENTMVVQEPNGKSLEVACTVYNQWSRCTTLPVNQSFQATVEKHGLEIRYSDQNHKMRKELYKILRENESSH